MSPFGRRSSSPRWAARKALGVLVPCLAALALSSVACGRSGLDPANLAIYEGGGGLGGSSSSSTSTSTSSTSTSSTSTSTSSTSTSTSSTSTSTSTSSSSSGETCPVDADQDGFVAEACPGGDDCDDMNPGVNPGHLEVCDDGIDDDCNGLADCKDPACAGSPTCGCNPNPLGELCDNGIDDNCNGLADCKDPACAGTKKCSCTPSESGLCVDGVDNDCDGQTDCFDGDCANDATCQCKNTPEDCSNTVDDNCNGLVDCKDPQCLLTAACKCVPPGQPENCSNGKDDDCNGEIDCEDPSCIGSADCKKCVAEVCDNTVDDNCNGLVDCADPACFFAANCAAVAEICNNGKDDNHNQLIDCDDPQCFQNALCLKEHPNCGTAFQIPNGSGSYSFNGDTTGFIGHQKGTCGGDAGEAVFYVVLNKASKVHVDSVGTTFDSVVYVREGSCQSGKERGCDDDSGGNHAGKLDFTILYPGTYFIFVDGFTVDPNMGPNEGPYTLNVTILNNPPEICDNGIDDDGNTYVDCADPACTSAGKCNLCDQGKPPTPEYGIARCTDGLDNDCNGAVDCKDTANCNASNYYAAECCNGLDDNGNGIIDEFACRCASDVDCGMGDLCYTHSVYACGIPCDGFFGDVCPFVAPGSYCNHTSHQCEFP